MIAVDAYRPFLNILSLLEPPDYGRIELFSFSGRIGRLRYLLYTSAAIALFLSVAAVTIIALGLHHPITTIALLIVGIPSAIFTLCIIVQRLHDFNVRAWWCLLFILLSFFSPAESIFFAALYLTPGNTTTNRFGKRPPPHMVMAKHFTVALLAISSIAVLFYCTWF